ncbi:hypothetical protein K1719_032796 [Acacia pycnantha]|nr:hypothetical protein K1719_032796 [Acacia pycnantha]
MASSSLSSLPLKDRAAIVTGASRHRSSHSHPPSFTRSQGYHRAIAVQADVSDPDQYPKIANTTLEDWDRTFNINTRGAFLCTREAANRLVQGSGGRIILITTSLVGNNLPSYGAYTASKAAVETMAKIVAKELKGTKITANCVAPGPTATELFFEGKTEETIKRLVDACPLERLGEPKDVSHLVGFLASDAGEWINGQVVRANGGFVV